MPLVAKVYISVMVAAGASVLGYSFWSWSTADVARYVFFLTVSVLASGMKVTLSAGAGTMSMNFLFILIGLESLSFGETMLMGALGILVQRYFHANHRPTAIQAVFNVAAMAVSVAATYAAFHYAASTTWFQLPLQLLFAAGAFYLANTLSVAAVIALTTGSSTWLVWRGTYFWSFPNYLLGAAVAWGHSEVSRAFGWQASLLMLPVLYVIYRSHRLYVEKLEEQTQRAEKERAHAQELAALHRRTIETLALAIEAKDQTTHDHLARVEVYAMAIGRELGLSEDELKALEAAALLHDIGKLAVPEYIISKPGKLTPEEFDKMKIHPVVGAELVEQVQFPYPVAPIVRAHHEKWDGTGYPDGLSAENIPIGARILAAVDCLDALATDRHYRRALPLSEALAAVQRDAGRAFDPRVVEVLSARYIELERKAKVSALAQRSKLSTDIKVERGAAPGAGFADQSASDLLNIHRSFEAEARFTRNQELGERLSRCPDADAAFALLREELPAVLSYDVLVLYRQRGECLVPEFLYGEGKEQFASLEIPLGMGLAGWVAENHKAIVNGNPSVEPGYHNDSTRFCALGSALAVPVEMPLGPPSVLSLYRRERDAFRAEEMRMLQAIASKLGRALVLTPQAL